MYKLSIPVDTTALSPFYKNFNIKSEFLTKPTFEVFKEKLFFLKGSISTEFGNIKLFYIDSLSKIYIEGQFMEGLDSLKEQVYFETIDGDVIIKTSKYYQPIINGIWMYYDVEKRRIISKRYFVKGFEVTLQKYNESHR